MQLGVHIGYWGLGLTRQDQLEIVLEAERLGYDSVWAAEAYGSDVATILGWIAGQTERIKIGSPIFQIPRRGLRLGGGGDPRLDCRPDRAHQDRLLDLPDARPQRGDDGDDRRHARPA